MDNSQRPVVVAGFTIGVLGSFNLKSPTREIVSLPERAYEIAEATSYRIRIKKMVIEDDLRVLFFDAEVNNATSREVFPWT